MKVSRNVIFLLVAFVAGVLVTLGGEWALGANRVSAPVEAAGARSFPAMVGEAMKSVPVITAAEAYKRLQSDPNTLIIDPRDAADIAATTGLIKGAVNISYGKLTYAADNQVPESFRDPRLADRSRPIITACYSGELGALTAKLLKDMGFTNVSTIQGGTVAWKTAGYPVQ